MEALLPVGQEVFAKYVYASTAGHALSFSQGDMFTVRTAQKEGDVWLRVQIINGGPVGYVPRNYVITKEEKRKAYMKAWRGAKSASRKAASASAGAAVNAATTPEEMESAQALAAAAAAMDPNASRKVKRATFRAASASAGAAVNAATTPEEMESAQALAAAAAAMDPNASRKVKRATFRAASASAGAAVNAATTPEEMESAQALAAAAAAMDPDASARVARRVERAALELARVGRMAGFENMDKDQIHAEGVAASTEMKRKLLTVATSNVCKGKRVLAYVGSGLDFRVQPLDGQKINAPLSPSKNEFLRWLLTLGSIVTNADGSPVSTTDAQTMINNGTMVAVRTDSICHNKLASIFAEREATSYALSLSANADVLENDTEVQIVNQAVGNGVAKQPARIFAVLLIVNEKGAGRDTDLKRLSLSRPIKSMVPTTPGGSAAAFAETLSAAAAAVAGAKIVDEEAVGDMQDQHLRKVEVMLERRSGRVKADPSRRAVLYYQYTVDIKDGKVVVTYSSLRGEKEQDKFIYLVGKENEYEGCEAEKNLLRKMESTIRSKLARKPHAYAEVSAPTDAEWGQADADILRRHGGAGGGEGGDEDEDGDWDWDEDEDEDEDAGGGGGGPADNTSAHPKKRKAGGAAGGAAKKPKMTRKKHAF